MSGNRAAQDVSELVIVAPSSGRHRADTSAQSAKSLLAMVTVAALIAAILLQFTGGSKRQVAPLNTSTRAAMAQANQAVKHVLSYDYRQLDFDVRAAKKDITGQLLRDYASTAKKVLARAASTKEIVTATVSAQSVVQADAGRVTVLMFVDSKSVTQPAGAETPTTRIDPLRLALTVAKVHGHWLTSDLETK